MTDYIITSSEEAGQADIDVVINGLIGFNESKIGSRNQRSVYLFARDSEEAVRGGLVGEEVWGWLHVRTLWVHESSRRVGLGTRLLSQAEQEAQERGCMRAFLDTFEFQALPFYEHRGYSVYGVIDDFPPGYRRYYLQKDLSRST